MAIKYQQTWGWSLININHVGIWIWHIDLLHDHRYTSHWRIIKPNSFWMLSYSSFFFLNYLKYYETFPIHRSYMYLATYYSSAVLFHIWVQEQHTLSHSNLKKQLQSVPQYILNTHCFNVSGYCFISCRRLENESFK